MDRTRECKILKECTSNLKELSKDTSMPETECYMTESTEQAVDFDKVKTRYLNSLGLLEENASSVDGIICRDDDIIFIEFKNGSMRNEKRKVKDKIRDSLLLFGDITGIGISHMRKYGTFILVYNEGKNPLTDQEKRARGVGESSPSLIKIARYFSDKAEEEFIRFDLERFKKLYFKNVYTYSKERFERYMNELNEGMSVG